MKTPRSRREAVRIVVRPPEGDVSPAEPGGPPSEAEAWEIAKAIRPRFTESADQYNTKKYWPKVYQRVRRDFRRPTNVAPGTLREALLWKYGHLGKPKIPPAHRALISQLQRGWRAAAATLPSAPEEAFDALDYKFGGKTRFITIAFLLHLLVRMVGGGDPLSDLRSTAGVVSNAHGHAGDATTRILATRVCPACRFDPAARLDQWKDGDGSTGSPV